MLPGCACRRRSGSWQGFRKNASNSSRSISAGGSVSAAAEPAQDAAPKKRGRLAKETAQDAAPKKRGRPAKESAQDAASKKRGRPAKETAQGAAPKKRGRPPKAKQAEEKLS